MADLRTIHGDPSGFSSLGIIRGQRGRLLQGRLRRLQSVGAQDHVAAVDTLRMQPQIRPTGDPEAQLVVLDIAAPDQDLKAVRGEKAQRRLRLCAHGLRAALFFQKACFGQLPPDIRQIALRLGALDLIEDRFEILALPFALGDQDGQMLPGRLFSLRSAAAS